MGLLEIFAFRRANLLDMLKISSIICLSRWNGNHFSIMTFHYVMDFCEEASKIRPVGTFRMVDADSENQVNFVANHAKTQYKLNLAGNRNAKRHKIGR
ncbi:MAG: hypothetical protein ABIL06_24380 [Pseudomonadota bacterium]